MKRAGLAVLLLACGAGRSTYARFPGGAVGFDRTHSDPKALAIADRVLAASGGAHWATTKQLAWSETITNGGTTTLDFDEAWDRWNGRHYGRLHTPQGDAVVMRQLYEDSGNAYVGRGHALMPLSGADATQAIERARERWLFDTTMLCLAFLLEEPGTTLEYGGEVAGEPGTPPLDDVKVTFDPVDRTRSGTWHAIVDRATNLIARIEVTRKGEPDTTRIGYAVSGWTDVHGIKLPTKLSNLGLAGEVITFTNVTAGDPDDTLYVPQVQ